MIKFEKYVNIILDSIMAYAPSLIGAIILVFCGFWSANRLERVFLARLKRSNFSPEITSFLGSMLGISLKIVVMLISASIAGFDTSALVGMLAAAGFAIGLALQGGLGNFASGILILVFKPYKVGDWIDFNGKFGKVEEIQIFNTLVVSPGLKTFIVPNGQITSNMITNYSKKGSIRLDIMVHVPYEESFPRVKAIIVSVLDNIPVILKKPEPQVGIESFDNFFIQISVKPYVRPDDYSDATYEIRQKIKEEFGRQGVQVRYPDSVSLGNFGE